jgi:hypothetical protein
MNLDKEKKQGDKLVPLSDWDKLSPKQQGMAALIAIFLQNEGHTIETFIKKRTI